MKTFLEIREALANDTYFIVQVKKGQASVELKAKSGLEAREKGARQLGVKPFEVDVMRKYKEDVELEEGSIKGSGTDRKAQLKKAYRAGEADTRDFNKPGGMSSRKPKRNADKGVKHAYDKGRSSNDGNSAKSGAERSKSQDALRGTHKAPDWAKGTPGEKRIKSRNKSAALARSKPKGHLPEELELSENVQSTCEKIHGRMMMKLDAEDVCSKLSPADLKNIVRDNAGFMKMCKHPEKAAIYKCAKEIQG